MAEATPGASKAARIRKKLERKRTEAERAWLGHYEKQHPRVRLAPVLPVVKSKPATVAPPEPCPVPVVVGSEGSGVAAARPEPLPEPGTLASTAGGPPPLELHPSDPAPPAPAPEGAPEVPPSATAGPPPLAMDIPLPGGGTERLVLDPAVLAPKLVAGGAHMLKAMLADIRAHGGVTIPDEVVDAIWVPCTEAALTAYVPKKALTARTALLVSLGGVVGVGVQHRIMTPRPGAAGGRTRPAAPPPEATPAPGAPEAAPAAPPPPPESMDEQAALADLAGKLCSPTQQRAA